MGSVFTEMDHNFINPLTARLGPDAFGFMTSDNGWASPQAWASYPTAELVVNEYMTWAAYLMFARDRISGDDLVRTESRTIRFMEQQRGFS